MSKFLKSLCKIAIPVTLQSMLQSSFSIVDQIMIGQLGETNISTVGLCGNFSLIFSVMTSQIHPLKPCPHTFHGHLPPLR